jgi:hypothetical protein
MQLPPPAPQRVKSWVEARGSEAGGRRGVPVAWNGPRSRSLELRPSAGRPATRHRPRRPPGSGRARRLPAAGPPARQGWPRPAASSSSPSLVPHSTGSSSQPRAASRSAPGRPRQAPDPRPGAVRQSPADDPAYAGAWRHPTGSATTTARHRPRPRLQRRASPPTGGVPSRHPPTTHPTGCSAPPSRDRMGSAPEGTACSVPADAPSTLPPPLRSVDPSCVDGNDPRTASTSPLLRRRRSATAARGESTLPRPARTPSSRRHACSNHQRVARFTPLGVCLRRPCVRTRYTFITKPVAPLTPRASIFPPVQRSTQSPRPPQSRHHPCNRNPRTPPLGVKRNKCRSQTRRRQSANPFISNPRCQLCSALT